VSQACEQERQVSLARLGARLLPRDYERGFCRASLRGAADEGGGNESEPRPTKANGSGGKQGGKKVGSESARPRPRPRPKPRRPKVESERAKTENRPELVRRGRLLPPESLARLRVCLRVRVREVKLWECVCLLGCWSYSN
jgi:hypothetical protein